ncbi:MAG: hypothetical protein JOZ39_10400 [Chloroflexi bacterium]|nr:hypothetical protein [Chloroflexota bacterium]
MPDAITQAIPSWHDFYMLSGTASATLMGLLFVSVSLKLDLLGSGLQVALMSRAGQAFSNLLYVLFISFVFLIPHIDGSSLGLSMCGIGATGMLRMAKLGWDAIRSKEKLDAGTVIWRFALPVLAHAALVAAGVMLVLGTGDGLYWVLAVIMLLLSGAARSAWDLLVRIEARSSPAATVDN